MSTVRGLALRCDLRGNITEILSNTISSDISISTGMPLARLAAPGGLHKALSFLEAIRANGLVFNWEINVAFGEDIKVLYCSGLQSGESLIIVGAESSQLANALLEDLMRMNNEQTNTLRDLLQQMPADSLFNEISKLNNELVTTQRELAKKNAELEHLNQEKNRFLGMAAHDLRNPLHAIMMTSEYLLSIENTTLNNSAHNFLETIYSYSRFMARLVDDLLDISKIEAGVLQLEYESVDLMRLIERNIARQRAMATQKDVAVTLETDPLPTTVVDPTKIEQVVDNLLSNAIKFSPRGGKIAVRLTCRDEQVLLSISDEGQGISSAEQATLFTPFRSKGTGTQGEKGTGLGLVIVKRIVEGHGGRIWLESAEGSGTTFYVSIPFAPKKPAGARV